jgi:hypothetical protein
LDAGADEDSAALARARSFLDFEPPARMHFRADLVELARVVDAMAEREGTGLRSVALRGISVRLRERAYRLEGRAQDGQDAVASARLASQDVAIVGACDLALEAARLSGELARDPSIAYAEAFRVERRARALVADGATRVRSGFDASTAVTDAAPTPASACLVAARRLLGALAPFRPAAPILEAIEQGIVGEGAGLGSSSPAVAAPRLHGAAHVVAIEHWPGRDAARVVVTLDKTVRFRVGDEPVAGGFGARTLRPARATLRPRGLSRVFEAMRRASAFVLRSISTVADTVAFSTCPSRFVLSSTLRATRPRRVPTGSET